MDLTIYIPTYKRAGRVTTLRQMPKSIMHHVKIVVRQEEFSEYVKEYPENDVVMLPEGITNLSQTRQWIMDNCKTRFLMQLDDDLDWSFRADRNHYKLTYFKDNDERFLAMLSEMLVFMDENDVVHCAVSAREGNNRTPQTWQFNERYMRAYIFDLDVVRRIVKYSEECCGCEDFHAALQLITAGHRSAHIFAYAQGQGTSNAKGGLSTYRTLEYHSAAITKLQEAFPKYVKLRKVKTKTAWQGQERTDCTVSWKKAYEESPKIIGASCPPADRLNP